MKLQSGTNTLGRIAQEAAMKVMPKSMLNAGMFQCFNTNVHMSAMTFLKQN